jgi:hypothetical protein
VARYSFFTSWGLYATTAEDLARQGPLAPVWWPLADRGPARALTQLTPRSTAADPTAALGRRWRHDRPDFWPRRSPLGRTAAAGNGADLRPSEIAGFMDDPEPNEEG